MLQNLCGGVLLEEFPQIYQYDGDIDDYVKKDLIVKINIVLILV
jgi:hypothetical protein